jgi:hypothetical protein
MRRGKQLILALALVGTATLPAASGATTEPKSLAEVEEFAFGGVGVAGIQSQGESFFRGVMDQPDAVTTFKKILGNGTPAAKLYALCGIRLLSEKDFDAAAAPLLKSNETVTTMRGCVLTKERVGEIARQIRVGSYDISLKSPPRPPPSR